MPPVELRPFQAELERRVYDAWNAGALNVMPVAATGSGKTVILSKILYDEPGASAAIAHRQELVSQISIALARNGVRHRIVGAKKGSPLIRVISALQVAERGLHTGEQRARFFHRHDGVVEGGRFRVIGNRVDFRQVGGHAGRKGGRIVGVLHLVERRILEWQAARLRKRVRGGQGGGSGGHGGSGGGGKSGGGGCQHQAGGDDEQLWTDHDIFQKAQGRAAIASRASGRS